MQRIRFLVSYDGTEFCGWQKQNHMPNKSVQQTLEEALSQVFQEKITLSASGRTDAGVHAIGQVCHFDTARPLSRLEKWDLAWAVRQYLPRSVSVKKVWLAPPDFHSTLSAERKTYRYLIYNKPRAGAIMHRYADWARLPINIDHLKESSQFLLGKQDFKSFQSVGTELKSTVREIYQADWEWRKPGLLQFTITGNGFMKQMVRNIVGTQLLLEKKGLDPADMKTIIAALDRKQAGPTAPAEGLYLMRVYYPRELDIRCREI